MVNQNLAIVDVKIVENLEGPNSLFKVFDWQNRGKPRNSGKILADGGVHYCEVLLQYTKKLWAC